MAKINAPLGSAITDPRGALHRTRGVRFNTYATFSKRNAMFGTQVHTAPQQGRHGQNADFV